MADIRLERNDHGSFSKTPMSITDVLRLRRENRIINAQLKPQKTEKEWKIKQKQRTRETNRKE